MGCNVAQGAITLSANGKKFVVQVSGNEDFTYQLTEAIKRGHDPAAALLFLAELGARSFHPLSPFIRWSDVGHWEELFGSHKTPSDILCPPKTEI